MTIKYIKERVEAVRIAASSGDHEAAHSLDDKLRADFIAHVAKSFAGKDTIADKAKAVLATDNIGFERWCA